METVAKQGGSERKNLRNSNRERVRVMRVNKKTRADSTVVDNFLGKCCPEQTHTQSLLRLFQRESGLERVERARSLWEEKRENLFFFNLPILNNSRALCSLVSNLLSPKTLKDVRAKIF